MRLVRRFALQHNKPIRKAFRQLYDEVITRSGINLYALSKSKGVKIMDIIDQEELMGMAFEIADNMAWHPDQTPHPADSGANKAPVPPHPAEYADADDDANEWVCIEEVDKETGEVTETWIKKDHRYEPPQK